MLFDGLGVDAINTYLDENLFLKEHLVCPISSVFPSTTTASTTSIQTGYAPVERGWLGWDLYFKELDKNVLCSEIHCKRMERVLPIIM